jgi:hypothetical protein
MRSALKSVAWTVWWIFILSLLFLVGAKAQDSPTNLTGAWVLNEKESDNFTEIMNRASGGGQVDRQTGRGKGQGGGGRGGGGRGGGRNSGSSGDEERQVRAQQKLTRAQMEYSRLEIFHDGIELNVTNGLDISRLLFTDGRLMNIWTQNGEATATASWQDRTLVVTWKTSQDTMSRIRYYTLAEGGQQLTMTESRRLPGQDKSIKIKMVYDLGG